ncbi:MAG TPA: hypothetical protein VFN88_07740 [Caulobacteraceae bacterium]|nr:hypothetical protein [Caulobacteraceae bacterium]
MRRHIAVAMVAFCTPLLVASTALAADAKATNKPAVASKATNKPAPAKPAAKATPATPATPASASKEAAGKPTAKATPATPATTASAAKSAAPAPKPAKAAKAKKEPEGSGGAVVSRSGNMVEWKTSTGKTLHYDCSKPGNKNKEACKK